MSEVMVVLLIRKRARVFVSHRLDAVTASGGYTALPLPPPYARDVIMDLSDHKPIIPGTTKNLLSD